MNSFGYSSLNSTPDDNPTRSKSFTNAIRRVLSRQSQKRHVRVVPDLAVACSSNSSVSMCHARDTSYFSVDSLKQEIEKSETSQESQRRTPSDYVVPGQTQGTEGLLCSDGAAKEDTFPRDSRKRCQPAQEMNSIINTQPGIFRDSVEPILETPTHEQENLLGTTSVNLTPERGMKRCTPCTADDYVCFTDDCHGGPMKKSPIDLHSLRELSNSVRSMLNELKIMKAMRNSQEAQWLRNHEVISTAIEDNRKELNDLQNVVKELLENQSQAYHNLQDAVKKLRDTQSQAHHDLHGAVEELRERDAHLNMVQNNEKRKVSWLTSRLDNVVDRLKDIDDSIKTSDGRTQSRFDAIATMMEQVLLITSKTAEKTRESVENKHSIDEEIGEIAHLSKRQTASLTVQPDVPTNMDNHTFPAPEEQLNNHSEPADPQENPAKRQGPGEYSVTEELQQTVEFNSIDPAK